VVGEEWEWGGGKWGRGTGKEEGGGWAALVRTSHGTAAPPLPQDDVLFALRDDPTAKSLGRDTFD